MRADDAKAEVDDTKAEIDDTTGGRKTKNENTKGERRKEGNT